MLGNIIKRIADKDYIIFCSFSFNFTSGGEQNCEVKIFHHDLYGEVQEEVDFKNIQDDLPFWLYGNYMVIWLGQILDDLLSREEHLLLVNICRIVNTLSRSSYELSDIFPLFDQKTKAAVIEKHIAIQFKFHKISKLGIVRTINAPILEDAKCQLYLFIILYDFFCKKYTNSSKLLRRGCCSLIGNLKNVKPNQQFQVEAGHISAAIAEELFNGQE